KRTGSVLPFAMTQHRGCFSNDVAGCNQCFVVLCASGKKLGSAFMMCVFVIKKTHESITVHQNIIGHVIVVHLASLRCGASHNPISLGSLRHAPFSPYKTSSIVWEASVTSSFTKPFICHIASYISSN